MTPLDTTWEHVTEGTYVRDKNGVVWKVIKVEFFDDTITLRRREGTESVIKQPPFAAPVTVMVPTDDEATATVQKVFPNATVEAVKFKGKPWGCAAWPKRSLRDAQSHLFMAHGVYAGDIKELKSATECHQASHTDETLFKYMPHTHEGETWPRPETTTSK
jgi:hypothetical protein